MNEEQFNTLMATLSSIGLYTANLSAQILRKEPLSDTELDGVQMAHAQTVAMIRERLAAGQDPFVDWKNPFGSLREGRADTE